MKDAVQIPVPSKDPEEKKDERPDRLDAPPKDDSKAPDNELVRTTNARLNDLSGWVGKWTLPPE